MGKAKKILVALLSAVFLCSAAVFAAGCAWTSAMAESGPGYTAAAPAADDGTARADGAVIPESVTIKSTLEESEFIYSAESSLFPYVEGTIKLSDGTTANLRTANIPYTIEVVEGNMIPAPGSGIQPGDTYDIRVVVRFTEYPDVTCEPISLRIKASTILAISARFVDGAASQQGIQALEQVPKEDLIVTVTYMDEGMVYTRTLTADEYTIRYANTTAEEEGYLQFGIDDSVTIVYEEGTQEKESSPLAVNVIEAPINVPRFVQEDGTEVNLNTSTFIFDETEKTFTFGNTSYPFKSNQMSFEFSASDGGTFTETPEGDEAGTSVTFKATDAGTYSVTFRVKEGYRFSQIGFPVYGTRIYKDPASPNEEEIIGVTYTWTIDQAEFTGIEFDFTATGWTYIGSHETDKSNAEKAPSNIAATYEMEDGTEQTVTIGTSLASSITVVYEKQNASGGWEPFLETPYTENKVPNAAGNYRVKIVVAATNNFEAAESDPINFTIAKATNTVSYTGAQWAYGEQPVTLDEIVAGLSSAFDADLGEIDTSEIAVSLTYNDWDTAFTITGNSLDWKAGSYYLHVYYPGNENIEAFGTAGSPAALEGTGSITVNKGTVYFVGSFSLTGWTFGADANQDNTYYAPTDSGFAVYVAGADWDGVVDGGSDYSLLDGVGSYQYARSGGSYAALAGFLAANDSAYGTDSSVLNAGNYSVRFAVPADGNNYAAANSEEASFTVSRREVSRPTLQLDADGYTYTGSEQEVSVNGFDAAIMSGSAAAADAGDTVSFNDRDALTAADAGTYTLTVAMTSGNYTWRGENTAPSAAPPDVELTWTIGKAQNVINAEETYAGWTYGNRPTGTDTLDASLAFTQDGQTIAYTYYAASDSGRETPVTISATTPAGDYVLVLSVAESENVLGATIERTFTVAVGSGTISAELGDTETWFYRDDLSEHGLSVSGTVSGDAGLTFGKDDCTVVYERSVGGKWESVEFSNMADAGNYRVTVSLTDSSNFTAQPSVIEFTIQKYVVDIPDFDRIHVYDQKVWTPDVPKAGLRGASWSISIQTEDSSNYGVYWLTLQLHDADNYAWGSNFERYESEEQIYTDHLDGEDESIVWLYYAITKTTYEATVNVTDYTYGDTVAAPTLTIQLSGSDLAQVNAAERTISYQLSGSGDSWTEYAEGLTLPAGEYRWRVAVAETENYSYRVFYGDFTVHPKELGQPSWSNLNGTYGTSEAASAEFTGILSGDDLGLEYLYTGTANDGTDYSSATAPTKAGTYTVTVTIGNANYCISGEWGDAVMTSAAQAYTIAKASITLKVDDERITYGDNAPGYTYTMTEGTLYYDDRLASILANVTLTYEDNYAAGDDATNYTVSFTNGFDLANYTVTPVGGTLTVDPFALTVTIQNPTDLVYNGNTKEATYTTNWDTAGKTGTAPVLALSYEQWVNNSYSTCGTPTEVGTYRAVVTMTDTTGNYTFTMTHGENYAIAAATITVEELSTDDIWYTGASYALEEYLGISTVNGQTYTVTFTVNSRQVTALTDAGSYTVGYTVTAPNHAEVTGSFTLEIQANTLVWDTEYDRDNWTYGQSATSETMPAAKFEHGTAASGIIGGAVIEYFTNEACTDRYTGGFSSTTPAGTYYVKVTVAGDGDNFAALSAVYSFTVNYAQLTIRADNKIVTYGDDAPPYTATISGYKNDDEAVLDLLAGLQFTLTSEYTSTSDYLTDGYAIVAADNGSNDVIVSRDGKYYIDGKYEVVFVDGILSMNKQTLQVTIVTMEDDERTYNGSSIAFKFNVYDATGRPLNAADVVTVEYVLMNGNTPTGSSSTSAPVNAGTYRVNITSTNSNYTTNAWNAEFTIRPREVEIVWTETDTDFYYNGTVQSGGIAASYALWKNGSISTETAALQVSLTAGGSEFRNANDGYVFTASFSGGSYSDTYGYLSADGNYRMAETNGHRTQGYTIAKRPITVTVTPQTAEYGDGYAIPDSAVSVTTTVSDDYGAVIGGDTAYRLQVQTQNGAAVTGTPNADTYYIRLAFTDPNYEVTLVSSTGGSTVTYTVTQRQLQISFTGGAAVTYGDALDEAVLRALIDFNRVNGEGEAFLAADSAVRAAVIAALNFDHGGYTQQTDAGSEITVRISGMGSTASGNYSFVYQDAAADLTVNRRPITVQIDSKQGLTYGTTEVYYASIALSSEVKSGSIVNNDTPYTLGVYRADGTQITENWRSLAVGDYYIVGNGTDDNYLIAFVGEMDYDGGTENAGLFEVVVNEITVTVNPSDSIYYTGSIYELLVDETTLTAFASEELNFEASIGTGETLSYAFSVSGQGSALRDVGSYTVSYTVSADNYEDETGSFTVIIRKNAVLWTDPDTDDWGWTYDDADAAAPVTEDNVADLFVPQFEHDSAAAGAIPTPIFAYFTDASCSDPFSGTFGSDTDAGTYYVRITVAGTDNYDGYEAVYSFTVEQKKVTVNWSHESLSLEQAGQTDARNYLIGYDPAIMDVAPGGSYTTDDLQQDSNGWYVDCEAEIDTYFIIIRLLDPDNYDWVGDTESETHTIRFTVSSTLIEVEVTIGDWTYGDASVDGPAATVSGMGDFDTSVITYAYAQGAAGLTEEEIRGLGFASVADLSMLPAGSYWVRAYVPGAEDGSYGMAFGYAHFTVSPYALTAPTAGDPASFEYTGTTITYALNGFAATVTLPNGQTVAAMVLSGNTGVNAGDYTAVVRLAGGNFVWAGGSSAALAFDWEITPQRLSIPTIGDASESSGAVYQSTYLPGEGQSLATQYARLFGFDAELMSFAASAGASYSNGQVAANYVGTYTITVAFKQIAGGNYCWADGSAVSIRLTWEITPATYDLEAAGFGYQDYVYEYVYNGQLQYPTLGNPPTGIRVTGYAGGATDVSEGVQTVTATLELNGPYATNFVFANGTTTTELTAEVQIAAITVADIVWSSADGFTYTGSDQSALVHAYFIKADGSVGDLTVAVQNGRQFVNAGSYTFAVTGFAEADQNYVLGGELATSNYTIVPVQVTVALEDPTSQVYTGREPALDIDRINDYGFCGFVVIVNGNAISAHELPQTLDRDEWAEVAPIIVNHTSAWDVGSYTVTIADDQLTNYEIVYVEDSSIAVTPAEIVGIEITVPNADGMVYGRLTEADAAYIDGNSDVDVVLGDGTRTTVSFSAIADFVTLYYSGYADGLFSTDVNAGTVWVFPQIAANASCNYTFNNTVASSAFAVEFTVQKQEINAEQFSVEDVYYTGAAQSLPRENITFAPAGAWQEEFAEFFADPSSVILNTGSYVDVDSYAATLTLSEAVYCNYCFERGSYAVELTWRILPLAEGDVIVTMPQVSVTSWGMNTAASVSLSVESRAELQDGTGLNVASFRYVWQLWDGEAWVTVAVDDGFVWNAGEYQVRGVIDDANFPASASEWVSFTVEQGTYAADLLGFADDSFVYDGTEKNLTLTVGNVPDADGVLTAAQLSAADGIGLTYTIGAGRTDVGSQEVTVTIVASSPNYVFMVGGEAVSEFTLTATLTVDALHVSVIWSGEEFVYDGSDHAGDVSAYFYNANNERIDLTVAVQGGEDFIDAGLYTFAVTGAAGIDLNNYELIGRLEDFEIVPAEVTVVWPQDSFVYNGEDQFGSVSAYFVGIDGANVALTLREVTFRNVNEGGYTFEVLGAQDDSFNMNNYRLTGTTHVLSIAPLAVTVTADDKSVVYGESAELTWHASEAVFEEDAEANRVVVSLSRESGSSIGSYTITVTVSGALDNYIVTTENGTYTIAQMTTNLRIELPEDRVYDGRPVEAWLVGIGGAVPSDVYLYYTGTANDGTSWASANAPTKAGTYTVEARTDNASYDLVCSSVRLVIERARAVIDVSGVQTHYLYTGSLQTVNSGAVLNHGETSLVYSNNTFTTVAEGNGLRVRIYAEQTANYEAAEAYVTITVEQSGFSFSVTIQDWVYGEEANDYVLSAGANPGGGRVTALYTGTTNAGEAYGSSAAPTQAGEYTLTVTIAATGNYLGGSASDTFTVHRAEANFTVEIEGWMYGEQPNGYALDPALFEEYIENVYYTDGSLYFMQPPTAVGEYTIVVEVAQSPNYEAGSAQADFAVSLARAELSVSIEGWTYGEAPNEPTVSAASDSEVTLRYTGTANDGTAWDSSEAPSKAGDYTLTATIVAGGNYAGETVSCDFAVARALVRAPSLGAEGEREASAVYDGEEVSVVVLGYDGARMVPQAAGVRFELDGEKWILVADEEGTYTVTFTLTDADNYAWAAEDGEDFSDGVVLTWTVTEKVDSLLWLIILLIVLIVLLLIALILLICAEKRARRSGKDAGGAGNGGEQGAESDRSEDSNLQDSALYALAPFGMLVVPTSHIAAVAVLTAAAAALLIVDICLFVRWRRAVRAARDLAAGEAEMLQEGPVYATSGDAEVTFEPLPEEFSSQCAPADAGEIPAEDTAEAAEEADPAREAEAEEAQAAPAEDSEEAVEAEPADAGEVPAEDTAEAAEEVGRTDGHKE